MNNNYASVENFQVVKGDCTRYTDSNLKSACEKGLGTEYLCDTYTGEQFKACACGFNSDYCPK